MKRKGIFAAYGAALALLALASVYDLFLSERLYAPNCLFAWVLEHYASVAAYGCYAFMMAVLAKGRHRFFLLGVFGFGALCVQSFFGIYGLRSWLLGIAFYGVLVFFALYSAHRMSQAKCEAWCKWILFYAKLMLVSYGIVLLIKLGWQRVRFRQIDAQHPFQCWWLPQLAGMAYASFPSAHTALTSSLLACFIKDVWKKRRISIGKAITVFGAIALMGLSRIIMGAHYLSDVCVAFLISFSVYVWLERKEKRKYGIWEGRWKHGR